MNLGLAVLFAVKDRLQERHGGPDANDRIFALYGKAAVLAAYPGWDELGVRQLLAETWTAPLVYEPHTGFKEGPRRGKHVNVLEPGFRMSKDQGPWPPEPQGSCAVFLFGGSTTFGYGLPDHETVASHLQDFLSGARLPCEPRVYNFGRGFYFSTQERILFEQLVEAGFVPDVAIFLTASTSSPTPRTNRSPPSSLPGSSNRNPDLREAVPFGAGLRRCRSAVSPEV